MNRKYEEAIEYYNNYNFIPSNDMMLPGINIIKVSDIEFEIQYKELRESIIINFQDYRYHSKLIFMPLFMHDGKIFCNNLLYQDEYSIEEYNDDFDFKWGLLAQKWIKQFIKGDTAQEQILNIHERIIHEDFQNFPMLNDVSYYTYEIGVKEIIAEVINMKVDAALARSQYKGYNGIMLEQTIKDVLNTNITQYIMDIDSRKKMKMFQIIDQFDKRILPVEVRGVELINNNKFAMNDSPQSYDSGRVVHILQNEIGSWTQNTSPYLNHIYSNRIQVRRPAVTQFSDTILDEKPLICTKGFGSGMIPGVNLYTAFMRYGHTEEDGIVISESARDKIKTYHVKDQKVEMPGEGEIINWELNELKQNETITFISDDKIYQNFEQVRKDYPDIFMNRTDSILLYKDKYDILQYIGNKNKIPAIIGSISRLDNKILQVSHGSTIVKKQIKVYKFHMVSVLKADIGDKLMGFFQGNKGTISKIVPDEQMPLIDNERLQCIMTPEMGKRGLALLHECHDSIVAKHANKIKYITPNTLRRDTSKAYGMLQDRKILRGYIRIVRLNKNVSEQFSVGALANIKYDGTYTKGAGTYPGLIAELYGRNCHAMLSEMAEGSAPIKENIRNISACLGIDPDDYIK